MNIFLWILQILLALLFMFAGVTKLFIPPDAMAKSLPSFIPYGFMYFIGVCEIFGAIGLVVPWATKIKPRLTPLAAQLFILIMLGAVITSLFTGILSAILPFVVGILCGVVAWGRSRDLKAKT